MHFNKEYASILAELPEDLTRAAINYRQLKKVINQLVDELHSLGLGSIGAWPPPTPQPDAAATHDALRAALFETPSSAASPTVIYELSGEGEGEQGIHPRLRIRLDPVDSQLEDSSSLLSPAVSDHRESTSVLWTLASDPSDDSQSLWIPLPGDTPQSPSDSTGTPQTRCAYKEIIIPLSSDTTFFTILTTALSMLSTQNEEIKANFSLSLGRISRSISDSARPSSASNTIVHSKPAFWRTENDLYVWREILSLYMEAEIFESLSERDRGERDISTSEERLKLFATRITTVSTRLSRNSRSTLEEFLQLNLYLVDLKKFYMANSEASRKILKKHAKRAALPSLSLSKLEYLLPSAYSSNTQLPHILVLALAETVLPVIPHLRDYECLICTGLAFKPIRLDCGHFFCVRCLVKMQKSGQGNCPVCRSPNVIVANRGNLDHALMRFMEDWFPREAKEKRKSNEKEAAEEELRELGLPTDGCTIQ